MSFEINKSGTLVWSNEKGLLHREKDPAIICTNGYISYRIHGESHRLDGPAVIDSNGSKLYYIHGDSYTKEEYYDKVKEL